MTTEGERLATVEATLRSMAGELGEIRVEMERTRNRLHSLEGISSTFLAWQKQARKDEDDQYRRLGLRIQVLTIVVGLAAVFSPLAAIYLTGR